MQKLGFIVFCLLNLIISPLIFSFLNFIILLGLFNERFINLIVLLLFLIIFKHTIIPFVYEKSNRKSSVRAFLDKIKNKNFATKLLCISLLFDIFSVIFLTFLIQGFSISNIDIKGNLKVMSSFYLLSFGGLFTSYLSCIFWFRIKNSTNIQKMDI